MILSLEERKRQLEVLRRINNWSAEQYKQKLEALEQEFRSGSARDAAPDQRGQGRTTDRAARRPVGVAASQAVDEDLRVAPYRFVEIADVVAKPPTLVEGALIGDATLLDTPLKDGFCGEIEVTWAAETPLLIGQPDKEADLEIARPLRLGEGGDWWIPGASIRGMIRAGAEIVGHGRLEQVNRKHVFALRDFEHADYNSKDGLRLGVAGAIKAGWLWKKGADWFIEKSELAYVEIADLLRYLGRGADLASWNAQRLEAKYEAAEMRVTGVGAKKPRATGGETDFTKVTRFRAVPMDAQGRRRVVPDKSGSLEGVLVLSGPTPKRREGAASARNPKHLEYAFLKKPTVPDSADPLDPEAFERFRLVHTIQGAKSREPIGSWAVLCAQAEAGKPVAVFYVGDLYVGDRARQDPRTFAFGLTRLFRVPHRYSIGAMIEERLPAHRLIGKGGNRYEPDFVGALFGFVHEPKDLGFDETAKNIDLALKGRAAFSGARILSDQRQTLTVEQAISTVMMAPKPSFAPFYLAGDTKDWSAADATLAGRKRYLPRAADGASAEHLQAIRRRLEAQVEVLPEHVRRNKAAQSHLALLCEKEGREFRFASRVRLHNVTAAEIGLILFVLTHGGDPRKPFRHIIGRAKPFGAGQLRVVRARLDIEANTQAGKQYLREPERDEKPGEGREGFCLEDSAETEYGRTNASHRPFLVALRDHMQNPDRLKGHARAIEALKSFPNVPAVRQFLGAADPSAGAELREAYHPTPGITAAYLPLADHRRLRAETQKDKSLLRAKKTLPRRLLPAPERQPGK